MRRKNHVLPFLLASGIFVLSGCTKQKYKNLQIIHCQTWRRSYSTGETRELIRVRTTVCNGYPLAYGFAEAERLS
jgi:hypothetical protein